MAASFYSQAFVPARRVCLLSITILSLPPSPPSFDLAQLLAFLRLLKCIVFTPAGDLTSFDREAVSCFISKLGKDALRPVCEKVGNL